VATDGVESYCEAVTVVLIGGPSATGKSTLADLLAGRLGTSRVDLDLFYIALRGAVPPDAAPLGLHQQDESFWAKPAQELVDLYLSLQTYLSRAFEPVLAQFLRTGRSAVMEGTWLHPAFASQSTYGGYDAMGAVRGLFLYEPEFGEMERRRRQRANPWDRMSSAAVMENVATMRHMLGLELKRQAEALGLPVLESRPFETLERRALQALGLT
jgi:2-phosphoglycerate kinase